MLSMSLPCYCFSQLLLEEGPNLSHSEESLVLEKLSFFFLGNSSWRLLKIIIFLHTAPEGKSPWIRKTPLFCFPCTFYLLSALNSCCTLVIITHFQSQLTLFSKHANYDRSAKFAPFSCRKALCTVVIVARAECARKEVSSSAPEVLSGTEGLYYISSKEKRERGSHAPNVFEKREEEEKRGRGRNS